MPGRHGRELEQGASAARVAVGELRGGVVPGDLEQVLLHPVVEPGAPEDELAQPVDERLALDEGNSLPVANQVPAEETAGLFDETLRGQFDQVGRLVAVQLVCFDEAELDGGCRDALLEVAAVEAEPIAEELDDVVVSGRVVGAAQAGAALHRIQDNSELLGPRLAFVSPRLRLTVLSLVACAGLDALAAWLLDWSFERAVILAPVVVAVAGATAFLVVLWTRVVWESVRARRRGRPS